MLLDLMRMIQNSFLLKFWILVINLILNRVSWGKYQADVNCVRTQCLLDGVVYKVAFNLLDVSIIL